jgi:hypothetical protein
MSDVPAWRLGRGPRVGEDICAWCEEEVGLALQQSVETGYLNLYVTDEDDGLLAEPIVRFSLPDASVDDPVRDDTLADLLGTVIGDYLNTGDPFRAIEEGEMLADKYRERFLLLRDVLHRYAEALDKLLGDAPRS